MLYPIICGVAKAERATKPGVGDLSIAGARVELGLGQDGGNTTPVGATREAVGAPLAFYPTVFFKTINAERIFPLAGCALHPLHYEPA